MLHKTPNYVWWESITGPKQAIESILYIMGENKIPVITSSFQIPYEDNFYDTALEQLREKNENNDIELIKLCASEYNNTEKLETFFLKELVSKNTFDEYRSNIDLEKFMIEKNISNNKLIWIYNVPTDMIDVWIAFVAKFSKKLLAECSIVLQLSYKEYIPKKESIKHLNLNDYITHHDLQLFSNMMLGINNVALNGLKRNYYATLIAHLTQQNAELAFYLIENKEFYEKETLEFIPNIVSDYYEPFVEGSQYDLGLLAIVNYDKVDEIIKRIWTAQLEVFFPLIQMRTKDIIKICFDDLNDLIKRENITQFGEKLNQPQDVELGTLFYLSPRIESITKELLTEISFLKCCRNKLAHGEICDFDEIKQLFNWFSI